MTRGLLRELVRWLARHDIAHAQECGEAAGACKGFAEGWNAATRHLSAERDIAVAAAQWQAFHPRGRTPKERIH